MNTIIKFSIFTIIISASIWFIPNLLTPKSTTTLDRSHQNSQINSDLKLLKTLYIQILMIHIKQSLLILEKQRNNEYKIIT